MIEKKMSTHGAVNIPVQIRRSMRLQPQDVIELEELDGALVLRPREVRCAFCGTDTAVRKLKGRGICESCLAMVLEQKGEERWEQI